MSDIEKIKQLRQSTGAGFKDCNAAIQESGGDIDKAIEHMKTNKIKLIGDKPTIGAENHKVIFIHPRSTGGILVELAEKIS